MTIIRTIASTVATIASLTSSASAAEHITLEKIAQWALQNQNPKELFGRVQADQRARTERRTLPAHENSGQRGCGSDGNCVER